MQQQSSQVQQTGFTLLELLVVMAIAGMLLALVVPRFGSAFAGARFQQQTQALNTSLKQARNKAARTGKITRLELSEIENNLLNAEGEVLYSWPEDSQLVFLGPQEEPINNGYIIFIPGAGSNGATLLFSQNKDNQQRLARFSINWLTGGVSYETL
ncbi:type II secretion system protein [Amphritea japonica]|uniref:General secretion pathway protein H n=1 Tax=Amphritea japonica ATCC BAA-1530 TaxID=1278309 RepID=A0A7R6PEK2_9GAMM|nr:type II secretion system protein [Amphritea japonica]BBB26756.1 general secretion pathway protein H [Amphritea japonica ATCC BAA-1530]